MEYQIINHPRRIPHRVVVGGSTEGTTGHYPASEKSRPRIGLDGLDKLHQRKSIHQLRNAELQTWNNEVALRNSETPPSKRRDKRRVDHPSLHDLQVADYVGVGPTRCCAICTNYNPIIEVINRRLRNAINQQELKGQLLQSCRAWIFTGWGDNPMDVIWRW